MAAEPVPSRPEATTVAIAGCGPAGALLGLMLAREGIDVLVLEKHADFFRDFRGDTIHPSTLDVLDDLGLFEAFDRLPQRRTHDLKAITDAGTATIADFRGLRLRHPYIAMVPQWDFLDFLTDEARRCPSFTLRLEAEVLEAVREGERVTGLRYRSVDGAVHEVRATLTVAADGRDSAVRRSVGVAPRSFGAPIDVQWFRLSRAPTDPDDTFGRLADGDFMAMINRTDYWQIGYLIPKGSRGALEARGLEAFRARLAALLPFLADRVGEIESWDDVRELEVQVNRLERWHRPGLLFVGDAAHAMSPIGGVGINLAIQDAVAAANLLAGPLRAGTLTTADLARVRRRRLPATALIQGIQRVAQARLIRPALGRRGPFRPPRALLALGRVDAVRRLPAWIIGTGVRPERPRVGLRAPERPRVPA